MGHRICFVICYFGQWPEWIKFYLESCRHNPSIDFLIFTDCGTPGIVPENVTIIDFTLAQFVARTDEKLGLKVSIESAYKVCDLKPSFGVIFEDYLGEYDFWGHTDIDIVYGKIRTFLTPELLGRYDVVTSRQEYLAGHMTLYRNNAVINRLYENSADYPRVFLTPDLLSFCECGKLWRHLHDGGSILDDATVKEQANGERHGTIESMTHVVSRMQSTGNLKVFFSTMIKDRPELQGHRWKLLWKEGCLHDAETQEQFLYFHMIGLKERSDFRIPEWERIPGKFYITRKGFSLDGLINENFPRRILNRLSEWIGRNPYNPTPY